MRIWPRAERARFSIGPPQGRQGQTAVFFAACAGAAAVLLLLGWLALGWGQWHAFLSSVFVTFAGLLLTVSLVEIALDFLRRLRLRPLRDELLRRLLFVVVEVLNSIAVVSGQSLLITGRPSDELATTADSLLLHVQTLFVTRIPRAGLEVPAEELARYAENGRQVGAMMRRSAPVLSTQILPLLAAADEDAELLRLCFRLAEEVQKDGPLSADSASESLVYLIHLAQAARNVLARLRALYPRDGAWSTVFEPGDIISMPSPPPGARPRRRRPPES